MKVSDILRVKGGTLFTDWDGNGNYMDDHRHRGSYELYPASHGSYRCRDSNPSNCCWHGN